MEQHEADLIRDLIAANRQEILVRLDTNTADIKEIKDSVKTLEKEYESVLIEQKAAKLAAELAATLAKENAEISEKNTRRLRNYIAIMASSITFVIGVLHFVLALLHIHVG